MSARAAVAFAHACTSAHVNINMVWGVFRLLKRGTKYRGERKKYRGEKKIYRGGKLKYRGEKKIYRGESCAHVEKNAYQCVA